MPDPIRIVFSAEMGSATAEVNSAAQTFGNAFASGAAVATAAWTTAEQRIVEMLKTISALGGDVGSKLSSGLLAGLGGVTAYIDHLRSQIAQLGHGLPGTTGHGGAGPGQAAQLGAANVEAQQLNQTLTTGAGLLQNHANFLGSIGNSWNHIAQQAQNFYFTFQNIDSLSRAAGRAIASPYESALTATDDYRKFVVGVSGVAGGMDRASAIDQQLLSVSNTIPLTLTQIRQVGLEMSKLASESDQISTGSPQQAAANIASYTQTVGRLASLNPYTDPSQILQGVNLLLEGSGNSRAVRNLLGIDPTELAGLVNRKPSDLIGNTPLTFNALQQYLGEVSPEGIAGSRGDLVSVIWQKLQDQAKIAFQQIGDQGGLYDHIRDRLNDVLKRAFDFSTSPQGIDRLKSIGQQMSAVFDNIGEAGLKLVENLTGARDLDDLPDAIARTTDAFIEDVKGFTKSLPGLASDLGDSLHSIAGSLSWFVSQLGKLRTAAQDPAGSSGSAILDYLHDKVDRLFPEQRRQEQLEALQQSLVGMGITGVSMRDYTSMSSAGPFGTFIAHSAALDTTAIRDPRRAQLVQQLIDAVDRADPQAMKPDLWSSPDALRALAGDQWMAKWNALNTASGAAPGGTTPQYQLPADIAEMKAAAERQGYLTPSFAAAFRGPAADLRLIGPIQDQDAFSKASRDASGAIDSLLAGGGVFNRLITQRDDGSSMMGDIIARLDQEKIVDPMHGSDIEAQIASLQRTQEARIADFAKKSDTLADGLVAAVGGFGETLQTKIRQAGEIAGAELLEQYLSGATPEQKNVASLLLSSGYGAQSIRLTGSNAILALQPKDQIPFLDAATQARIKEMQQLAGGGMSLDTLQALTAGTAPKDLLRMANFGALPPSPSLINSLFGRTDQASQMAGIYQNALDRAKVSYNDADAALAANPNDPAARAQFQAAAAAVADYTQKLQAAQTATNTLSSASIKFGNDVQNAFENSLGQAIAGWISGVNNMRQVLQSFAKDILNTFSQAASHNIVDSLIGSPSGKPGVGQGAGGLVGFLLNGLFSGMLRNQSANQAADLAIQGANVGASVGGAANGGVWGGITFFSSGGVATHPMLGVVGERHDMTPEGIIPLLGPGRSIPMGIDSTGAYARLPGGRKIPAAFFADGGISPGFAGNSGTMFGGFVGGGDLHIYNAPTREDAAAMGYRGLKNEILNEVHVRLGPGGTLRRQLARPA